MRAAGLADRCELSADELAFDPWEDEAEKCRCCSQPLTGDEGPHFCDSCLEEPEHAGVEFVSGQVRDRYRSVLP